MRTPSRVALVGAGAMGGALLKSWLAAGVIDVAGSSVVDPAADAALRALAGASGLSVNPPSDAIDADILVFAVKPQAAAEVLPAYAALARRALVVSVMAGTSVAGLARHLGVDARIVRAMPNLAVAVGAGVTGLFAPPVVDAAARRAAEALLAPVGETVWVTTEEAMAAVTAVSGSGPAYFFLLTEALAESGRALGLDKATAEKLARATAEGAGAMLAADARTPAQLRLAVTSRGGTTAAALDILDGAEPSIRSLMKKAAAAAAHRARELTE